MHNLKVRKGVRAYVRDTYLGVSLDASGTFPVINCSLGCGQWGVSEKARSVDLRVERSARYPELFHETLLKPSLIRRFDVAGVAASNLFLGHGSFNLAERLIHKLIEPSVMVGVGPQFNEIPSEFVAAGGTYRPVFIERPAYAFPLERLLDAIRQDTSVVYIDNPNNPLGRVIDLETIATIARHARAHGAIVIIDEAYGDFIADERSAVHLIPSFDNLAVLRSFSKALGLAAARVGYAFLSSALATLYAPLDVPFEPSLISAILARATTEDHAFIARVREEAYAVKSAVMRELRAAGFEILPTDPAVSILTVHREAVDVANLFASVGVVVEPGQAFSKTHPAWDTSYCRLRIPPLQSESELCLRLRMLHRKDAPVCY